MPTATDEQFAQRAAFGKRVRQLRAGAGISQEELAHGAGLDRSYVGQVERDERNVSLDHIYRLAIALSREANELL